VIGEDCSTDSTGAIIRNFQQTHPDTIHILTSERNQGPATNFIRTMQACRGQYIATLEGDDYWISPMKLQSQVDFLDSHIDYSMCFHTAQVVRERGDEELGIRQLSYLRDWEYVPQKPLTKDFFGLEDLLEHNFIQTSSVMFRNELQDCPAWLFSRLSTLTMFDWFLFVLNAERGKIGFINEIMSVYRIHAAGAWSAMNQANRLKMIIRVLELLNVYLNYRHADKLNETISRLWLSLFLEKAEDPFYALLNVYWTRDDLQKAWPEVREGKYGNLLNWARNMCANPRDGMRDGNYPQLSRFSNWFKYDGRLLIEMDGWRKRAISLVDELDAMRRRRIVAWIDRFFDRSDIRTQLGVSLKPILEDNIAMGLKGYRLRTSSNLASVSFLHYIMNMSRQGLTDVLLVPTLNVGLTRGELGLEITSGERSMARSTVRAVDISESEPTRFTFPSLRSGAYHMQVFARDVDGPIRILEWQKNTWHGFGPLRTKPFCGLIFNDSAKDDAHP
jgi:glycosyltransferase involved in cell wall biosynthesis